MQEIQIDSRSNGCYLKETSGFHMNLPGLYPDSGGKKDLYVNVTDFRLPTIEKRLTFSMHYGFDTTEIQVESVKEYSFVFSSFNEFAQQLRCAVFNDFLYKSKCVRNKEDEPESRDKGRKDEVETVFSLRFVDGAFELMLDEYCVLFASVNLFEFMGFKAEVSDGKSGKNGDKVLVPNSGADTMKICKRLTCGTPVHFLNESDRVCHLVIDRCVEPAVYFNGGRYGVVCSYDLMERKLMSNYKRFSYAGMRSISFSVLNNDFKAFDFGCCLKSQSLRFVLNIVKKID